MRLPVATALALALLAGALGGCGEEDAELLPGGTAREITANLDAVEQLADEGDCAGAESAALQVSEQVEALRGIDARLERALEQGAARLREVVARCEEELEVTEPEPVEPEIDEDELAEREKEEEKELKEEEKREAEEAKREDEDEDEGEEGEGSLPPQAEGEGNGVEGENGGGPPPAVEDGAPSGGVSPANPAGEG
jgi:hypothetical protein